MNRYKELIYESKTYTENYKINEILIKNGFDWFLDCEVENVRLEILKNTLVFNSGVFFNGTWIYGVFRNGQWKYGTWEGGVWYNGTWYNGIFKNGLIFNGRFINGKIEGGEIRGGEFFDIEISKSVIKSVEKENKNSPKPQQGKAKNRSQYQRVQGQIQPVEEQSPLIQPNKIEERVKRFDRFVLSEKNILDKVKKFFVGQPGKDDEIGLKILDYLNNNDVNVIRKPNFFIYYFVIKLGNNDIDPLGEEIFEEDLKVEVEERSGHSLYNIIIKINDDILDLHNRIKFPILDKIKSIYEDNKNKSKIERLNKYKNQLRSNLHENKYNILPIDEKDTKEIIIKKSFDAEFGDNPTTTKQRLDFANEISKEIKLPKYSILKIIKDYKKS